MSGQIQLAAGGQMQLAAHTQSTGLDNSSADNLRGGEVPTDADDIRTRCETLSEERFTHGVMSGAVALVLATAALLTKPSRERSNP